MALVPSFSLLPNELVREVILAGIPPQGFIDERDNFPAARYRARWLVRLAGVSKEWKEICIPLLYHEAIFELSRQGEQERLDLFYRRLDFVPSLGRHVHRLHWTQDFYQSAEDDTKVFLDRYHLFPSLESVSILSTLSFLPTAAELNHPTALPNLKSLRLVSWDAEPGPDPDQPPFPQPTDEWYRQRCLVTSNAFGSLANLEELHFSFENIVFVYWLLSALHRRTHPLALKHLSLYGSFVLPSSHPTPTSNHLRPFHHLLSLLTLVGPTLQTLHLNKDDPALPALPLPFPSEVLSLCPNLVQLSLDTTPDLLPLTLSSLGPAMMHLTSLWIGHSAWQRRSDDNGQAIKTLVEGVAAELLPFLAEIDDDEGDASKETERRGRRSKFFPKLKEVGFWSLDFRLERSLYLGEEDGVDRDWEWEEVKHAGWILDESAGVRLVDRFGSWWWEGMGGGEGIVSL